MKDSIRNAVIVVLSALLMWLVLVVLAHAEPNVLPDPPIGWWGQPDAVLAPCPGTGPGPHPYMIYNNPIIGGQYYLREDGTVRPVSGEVDGHFSGEGGSTHTLMYTLDGMELFIRTGVDANGDGIPDYVFTAPWRDAPIEGHPATTLCDKWRQGNKLPPSAICPSNLSALGYSMAMDNFQDWTSTQAGRNAQIAQWCGSRPSPTPPPVQTPAVTPTKAPTPVPTPDPAAAYIEWLYNEGGTSGCSVSPLLYCPDRLLTRRELAVILQKMLCDTPPPPCVGIFQDVKCAP